MKKRKVLLIAIVIICLFFLAYLLYPLSGRRWGITFNDEAIERKKIYLREQRESKSAGARPNIVIILADDLGKTDISLYGGRNVDTVNIDEIGNGGVVFTEAYCTSPICAPSRAGMLTGRYQQRYGLEILPHDRYPGNRLEYYAFKYLFDTGNWEVPEISDIPETDDIKKQGLLPSEINLAEILDAGGYATAITGKWHLGYGDMFIPGNRGFRSQYGFYEAFSLYASPDDKNIINQRHEYFADKYIWSRERSGPCAIRRNNEVVEEKRYLTFAIADEAVRFIRENKDRPFFLYVPFNAPHTPFQVTREYYEKFSHVKDRNKRVYYAMIAALDHAVGRITAAIREFGLDEKTLIFFSSDNGGAVYTGATDNAPLRGGKFTSFEGGLNVPCAIQWKGVIPPGKEFTRPVSLLDFFATAAAASRCVLPRDRDFDGIDLLPYMRGIKKGNPHEALFWRSLYNRAVRKGKWKLIRDDKSGRVALYDLTHDKEEKHNLAGSRPEVVKMLDKDFREWEKKLINPLWPRVMDYRYSSQGEDYYFPL